MIKNQAVLINTIKLVQNPMYDPKQLKNIY